MENKIKLYIVIIILDVFIWLFTKKVYNLKLKNTQIILSQLCNIASLTICVFLEINLIIFIMIRLFSKFLTTLLVVDDYELNSIFNTFSICILLSLLVYGYYEFLLTILKSLNIINSMLIEIFLAIFFVLFYIFLYVLFKSVSEKKNLHVFLANVSFFIAGKHINLKGLIDSGNSVYDKQSNLPVVLLSIYSLKKHFPLASFDYVCEILSSHYEKCMLVGGESLYVPIVKVDDCMVEKNGNKQMKKFVIGIVNQKFYDERNFDCLIHRDFY